MKALVLDVSATLGFLLKDEQDRLSLAALANIEKGVPASVPSHWIIEVANALLMAERRKRISQAEAAEILHLVQTLPITVDDETARHMAGDTYALARQFGLTIYDAAYLELAMRQSATLATTDQALAKAARAAGVALLQE
jgi:predicted nucleic acid-binding protein